MSVIVKQDPKYIEQRHRQFMNDMKPFAAMLEKIYSAMPPIRVVISKDEVKQIIEPEWQQKIDQVLIIKNEFIRSNYPEYLP